MAIQVSTSVRGSLDRSKGFLTMFPLFKSNQTISCKTWSEILLLNVSHLSIPLCMSIKICSRCFTALFLFFTFQIIISFVQARARHFSIKTSSHVLFHEGSSSPLTFSVFRRPFFAFIIQTVLRAIYTEVLQLLWIKRVSYVYRSNKISCIAHSIVLHGWNRDCSKQQQKECILRNCINFIINVSLLVKFIINFTILVWMSPYAHSLVVQKYQMESEECIGFYSLTFIAVLLEPSQH